MWCRRFCWPTTLAVMREISSDDRECECLFVLMNSSITVAESFFTQMTLSGLSVK